MEGQTETDIRETSRCFIIQGAVIIHVEHIFHHTKCKSLRLQI